MISAAEKLAIARDVGLDLRYADRLRGSTVEAVKADAVDLREALPNPQPQVSATVAADLLIRGYLAKNGVEVPEPVKPEPTVTVATEDRDGDPIPDMDLDSGARQAPPVQKSPGQALLDAIDAQLGR